MMKSKGKNNMALWKDVACTNHKNLPKEKTHLRFSHKDFILKNNYVDSHVIRHTDVADKKTTTQIASPSAFGQSFHHRWWPENNM
ncbi:hypothetical protein KUTeg_000295 [Tegillarca granosa]|uniref:Uncharacterized protein n=1 Tax=Tegillarca granosa TaxID=220873 RepID=A0ABQ9FX88_TEGGR|nr:hypothetical protein KUTeg_000295 [Tegillarca granosa]